MKTLPVTVLLLAASLLVLPGCILQVKDNQSAPTAGQQLCDLKKARDAGAITEEEYQAQRGQLLGAKH